MFPFQMPPGVGKLVVDDQGEAAKKEEDQGENPTDPHSRLQFRVDWVPENAKTNEKNNEGFQPVDGEKEYDLITFVAQAFIT